jgi:hypothetical protein
LKGVTIATIEPLNMETSFLNRIQNSNIYILSKFKMRMVGFLFFII